MKDRTDNDIKNYWNMHLKKKLAKTGTSESGASGSAKMKGDGAAAPAPKGQWERWLLSRRRCPSTLRLRPSSRSRCR
jgi:myb proto-oncogene protein